MTDQPEALRLADLMAARRVSRWSAQAPHLVGFKPDRECVDAARLLREQHAEIERLREVLDKLEYSFDGAIKRYPDEHEVEVALQQG